MHFFSKHFPKEKNSKAIFKQCNSDDSSSSARLREFFREHFDARRVERRFRLFQRSVIRDRDRVRLHGQYYNNIYLGKRIFGPARKQMFVHSILGGMERRFEIIDNQINHIPFTHDASDKHKEKCRNPRIKCRDDTRVVLTYNGAQGLNFIHANRVATPVLFNDFIITQAPLPNTVADFWKLVWQEGVKHIFMLISRDTAGSHRCAEYWPKHENAGIECHGLHVVNQKVDTTRDPFFRVTTLLITERSSGKNLVVEHWEGNLNNSSDIYAPLRLLKVSRNQDSPTIVHDHLGVSRAAVLVAIELTICNLLRGPTYKFPVQQAVHYLRSFRAFSVETPMQYIYIHRVVLTFIRPLVGEPESFEGDYDRWLEQRAKRAFIGDPLVANVSIIIIFWPFFNIHFFWYLLIDFFHQPLIQICYRLFDIETVQKPVEKFMLILVNFQFHWKIQSLKVLLQQLLSQKCIQKENDIRKSSILLYCTMLIFEILLKGSTDSYLQSPNNTLEPNDEIQKLIHL